MKLVDALDKVIEEYDKADRNTYIRKPISYALYQAWKWCDEREKER